MNKNHDLKSKVQSSLSRSSPCNYCYKDRTASRPSTRLSSVLRGTYLDGWPNANTPCCNNFFFFSSLSKAVLVTAELFVLSNVFFSLYQVFCLRHFAMLLIFYFTNFIYLSRLTMTSTVLILAEWRTRVTYQLSEMTLPSMSSPSSEDKAAAMFSAGHRFDFDRWLSHFITELKIHHLYSLINTV